MSIDWEGSVRSFVVEQRQSHLLHVVFAPPLPLLSRGGNNDQTLLRSLLDRVEREFKLRVSDFGFDREEIWRIGRATSQSDDSP